MLSNDGKVQSSAVKATQQKTLNNTVKCRCLQSRAVAGAETKCQCLQRSAK